MCPILRGPHPRNSSTRGCSRFARRLGVGCCLFFLGRSRCAADRTPSRARRHSRFKEALYFPLMDLGDWKESLVFESPPPSQSSDKHFQRQETLIFSSLAKQAQLLEDDRRIRVSLFLKALISQAGPSAPGSRGASDFFRRREFRAETSFFTSLRAIAHICAFSAKGSLCEPRLFYFLV